VLTYYYSIPSWQVQFDQIESSGDAARDQKHIEKITNVEGFHQDYSTARAVVDVAAAMSAELFLRAKQFYLAKYLHRASSQ
jgi:hypothetical protein